MSDQAIEETLFKTPSTQQASNGTVISVEKATSVSGEPIVESPEITRAAENNCRVKFSTTSSDITEEHEMINF